VTYNAQCALHGANETPCREWRSALFAKDELVLSCTFACELSEAEVGRKTIDDALSWGFITKDDLQAARLEITEV
jgi:hypothetical protein